MPTHTQSHRPRTLIFSLRNIFKNDLFRCALYEFEDIISQIDDADIVAPKIDPASWRTEVANLLAFHAPIVLKPSTQELKVDKPYDLFLAICGHPRDLLMVEAFRQVRDSCATKVCLMDEVWVKQMDNHRYFLRVLKEFDLVVMYYSQSVKALSERIGTRCVFLPPGVDSMRFCPYPTNPQRVVDVYSVGRRSQVTHEALLDLVDECGLFYLHDSISGTKAINPGEHRRLFANVAKRSKYFIVNPGLIDMPERRGDQIETGNRYFEGCAAGVIMIGETPANGEFEKLFDWPGALIHLPYDSDGIAAIIHDLNRQPELLQTIRRANIKNALARHDWAYRWESILQEVGLDARPGLARRKEHLSDLAEAVSRDNAMA